jgi:hypothetical protein
MKANSLIGEIIKGSQPAWSFDILGMPPFWTIKARELHRMVELGYIAWRDDITELRQYVKSEGLVPFQHNASTLTVAFFLAALAIENLLKAHLLRIQPESIKDGKFRGQFISSHSLLDIAAEANVALTEEEKDFCELGTEAIYHFGRYHIGKSVAESPCKIVVRESAFPVYEAFYSRLLKVIDTDPFKKSTNPIDLS